MNDSFIVVTEYGPVLVSINPDNTGGFDPDLLLLSAVTREAARDAAFETPLRAFAAKMVDIIEGAGTSGFSGSERMREMMVSEKATSDLRRIERWAQQNG